MITKIQNKLRLPVTLSFNGTSITLMPGELYPLDLGKHRLPLQLTITVREGGDAENASAWVRLTFLLDQQNGACTLNPVKETSWNEYDGKFFRHATMKARFPASLRTDGILIVGTVDLDKLVA
jgi:hypothetical protein